jgi:hypothetical protein
MSHANQKNKKETKTMGCNEKNECVKTIYQISIYISPQTIAIHPHVMSTAGDAGRAFVTKALVAEKCTCYIFF